MHSHVELLTEFKLHLIDALPAVKYSCG